jgi:hypothetical protein
LAVPLHYKNLRKEDRQPVIDKVIKKSWGWRGKLLAYKAKFILHLTSSVLLSFPSGQLPW